MSIVKYKRITEPEELKSWAEDHEAEPAAQSLPGGGSRLTFNTDGKRDGEPLDWDAFLEQFKNDELALLVEPDDSRSHYFKIVHENDENAPVETGNAQADRLTKQAQNEDFRAK